MIITAVQDWTRSLRMRHRYTLSRIRVVLQRHGSHQVSRTSSDRRLFAIVTMPSWPLPSLARLTHHGPRCEQEWTGHLAMDPGICLYKQRLSISCQALSGRTGLESSENLLADGLGEFG